MIMGTLQELANEYAALTGRPVATLSVQEFISLKEFAQREKMQVQIVKPAEMTIPQSLAVNETTHTDKADKTDNKDNKIAEMQKRTADIKDKSKSSILNMLKSVPG